MQNKPFLLPKTPCNCGSGLYNIHGIPENQCYDCYKGRCACGIHDVLCKTCNKASQKTSCKCNSGLYNIPKIPEGQCFDCYKGRCECGILDVLCTTCNKKGY